MDRGMTATPKTVEATGFAGITVKTYPGSIGGMAGNVLWEMPGRSWYLELYHCGNYFVYSRAEKINGQWHGPPWKQEEHHGI